MNMPLEHLVDRSKLLEAHLGQNQVVALTGGMAQLVEHYPTKQRSPVQFPIRAHAWVAGPSPWLERG